LRPPSLPWSLPLPPPLPSLPPHLQILPPLLPFTCTACGTCFLTEAKLGEHVRKSILGEWKCHAPGPHELFTPSLTAFNMCNDCGLPFLHKGFISHTKTCKRVPPRRVLLPPQPLPPQILSPCLPNSPLPINRAQPLRTTIGPTPRSRLSSLPSFSTVHHESAPAPASMEGSSTPGSSAAQALQDLMISSIDGEEKWLLNEFSLFNVLVKRRAFPKEASSLLWMLFSLWHSH